MRYIPLDKSWIIRLGVLDLVNGYNDCIKFLEKNELSEDLQALYRASIQWNSGGAIDVGESGTLYRFLKFAAWKRGLDKRFIVRGTLKDREICDNPQIVDWPVEKLLTLDNGTSQWASAAVLMGNNEKISDPPYKLQVTYDVVEHWKNARNKGQMWESRFDGTIMAQASAYLQWLKNGKMDFKPRQVEDYCFAKAFGISAEKWPSLRGHESDRIADMELAMEQEEVTSKDHRVVQAIAMLKKNVKIRYPSCVNKSWPQFWKFLKNARISVEEFL